MNWSSLSSDEIEQVLVSIGSQVSRARALELDALEELDRRQVFMGDGCATMSEWVAGRLDLGSDTARRLVLTMRRTVERPDLRSALVDGVSFDRVEAVSRIVGDVGMLDHLDISGVRRHGANRTEITDGDEAGRLRGRYLVMQPSLDESWWTLTGGLDGVAGSVIDNALSELADRLPNLPDGHRPATGWRRATALYELASGGETPQATVTVFINADQAAPSDGRAGVRLEAGPRVGAVALKAILCNSITEVTVNTKDGVPMRYGRTSRTIPPVLRRAILATTDGYCAIDGCDSRYRIEIHHKTPWAHGGTTDPENLIALCWFHHHIVIHERGFQLHQHPDTGRTRLRPTFRSSRDRPRNHTSPTRTRPKQPARASPSTTPT
jgi:hypothetical protein